MCEGMKWRLINFRVGYGSGSLHQSAWGKKTLRRLASRSLIAVLSDHNLRLN